MSKIRLKKSSLLGILKICLITLIILESDGLITQIIGVDRILAAWSFAGFMSSCAILAISLRLLLGKRFNLLFSLPYIAFLCAFLVSAGSALFIFPKGIYDWLPSLYMFTLVFSFYFLYLTGATARDVAISFFLAALIVSLLLFMDQLMGLTVLDFYKRASSFDIYSRRIVILKNEVVLGIMFLFAYIFSRPKIRNKEIMLLALLGFLLYVQITVMESRLAATSIAVGFGTIIYLNRQMKKTYSYLFAASLAIIATLPLWIDSFFSTAKKAIDYDSNISIRFETINFMYELYKKSYGWGVGMMSSTGTENNVLFSDFRYNFIDGGALATIFQFGLSGLIVWLSYTALLLRIFKKAHNHLTSDRNIPLACFAFLVGFTFNPLPLNFFLGPTTMFIGGALLYFAWLYAVRRS